MVCVGCYRFTDKNHISKKESRHNASTFTPKGALEIRSVLKSAGARTHRFSIPLRGDVGRDDRNGPNNRDKLCCQFIPSFIHVLRRRRNSHEIRNVSWNSIRSKRACRYLHEFRRHINEQRSLNKHQLYTSGYVFDSCLSRSSQRLDFFELFTVRTLQLAIREGL